MNRNELVGLVEDCLCNNDTCPIWSVCKGQEPTCCVFFDALIGEKGAIEYTKYFFPDVYFESLPLLRIIIEEERRENRKGN